MDMVVAKKCYLNWEVFEKWCGVRIFSELNSSRDAEMKHKRMSLSLSEAVVPDPSVETFQHQIKPF